MDPKTKMKIRTAVADYQRMFPEEYQQLLVTIEMEKESTADPMAGLRGTHHITRQLFTISETLSQMIAAKLDEEELGSFKELKNARWFAKEFPQFRITKHV